MSGIAANHGGGVVGDMVTTTSFAAATTTTTAFTAGGVTERTSLVEVEGGNGSGCNSGNDSSNSNNNIAAKKSLTMYGAWMTLPQQKLAIHVLIAISLFHMGWYYPKHVIEQNLVTIARKPVPYQTTQAGDVILDGVHNRPLIDPPTISSEMLICTSVYLPLVFIAAMAWLWKYHSNNLLRWHDLHAAVCGLLCTIGLSEALTHFLKLYMQQRRPNFYALCQFDATQRKCMASIQTIGEANLSFPSGHSSLSCCAMTFLIWFLLGKLQTIPSPNNNNGSYCCSLGETKRLIGFMFCIVPWSWTLFVAASRVADSWHHPADVVAGLILGGCTGTLVYHCWYPPVWSMPLSSSSSSASSPMAGNPWSYHHSPTETSGRRRTLLPTSSGGIASETKPPSFHE